MPERPHSCPPLLYTAGGAPRLGRVDDGSAITGLRRRRDRAEDVDCDRAGFCRWGKPDAKVKINLLDTPASICLCTRQDGAAGGGRGAGG